MSNEFTDPEPIGKKPGFLAEAASASRTASMIAIGRARSK